MKRHGPNSPLTIRGLRDRYSQRGNLDARAQMEADLGTAEMVGPWGKGFDLMKNPGGSQTYIVGNLAGGTLAPGASGLVGNTSGRPGALQRLGRSPAGKKGPGNAARSARRRGSVTTPANQYAFGSDGVGSMLAMLYADGLYVSTRATETEVSGLYTGCITTDSSETVGVGSLLMKDGDTLKVWDVEGSIFYTYTPSAGWLVLTPAYYQNGKLYWIECEDFPDVTTVDFDVRLRRADTDLSNVATITTRNLTIAEAQSDLGGSTIEYFTYGGGSPDVAASLLVDADGAVVYFACRPQDGNGERTDYWPIQFRFALSGGAPTYRLWTEPEGTEFSGVTLGTTSFAFFITRADLGFNQAVMAKSDDASAAAADLWSTSTLDGITAAAISIGTGGDILQIHSVSGSGYLLRGVGSGTVVTSSIEPFDETPNYPTALYFFGE